MATRQSIREAILAELGHVDDANLTDAVNRGINVARRIISNLKGGKLKILRARETIVAALNTRYTALPADCRQVYLMYNLTDSAQVIFQDEHAWRAENGAQADDDIGDVGYFLTDAPLSAAGLKQVEWVHIPDKNRDVQCFYWRTLPDLTDADDAVEITDLPLNFHYAIEAYARLYALRHVSAAADRRDDAKREWEIAAADVASTEDDTTLRSVRVKCWSETLRAQHRAAAGVPEGEY